MSRSNLLILVIMLFILVVAGWFTYRAVYLSGDAKDSEAARSLVQNVASDEEIIYTSTEGDRVDLSEYAGRIRVVNSWATWTPFSKDELIALNRLASEMTKDEGVVIAINRAESAEKIKAYLNKLEPLENIIFIQDANDSFYDSIEGFSMPETVFYDKTGKIIFHKRGHMKFAEMQEQLNKVRNNTSN